MKRIPAWLKVMMTAVLIVLLVKTFAFTSCTIPSIGMENSLYQGERVLVNKWSYGLRIPFTSSHLFSHKIKRGDIVLFNNPAPSSNETPLFVRELFISRCVGVPGDTLLLDKNHILAEDKAQNPDRKSFYAYPHTAEDTLQQAMERVGIRQNTLVGYSDGKYLRSFSHYEYYLLCQELDGRMELLPAQTADSLSTHPFVVPLKGRPVQINSWNAALLCNTIQHHEGHKAEVRNDSLFLDGKYTDHYVFRQNYYWMASNNPVNLCDSRLFGLVPHTHVVGRASYIWYSPKHERIFQSVE